MQINTATMITSQTTTAPRSSEPAGDFAPLVFKKSAAAPAQPSPQTAPRQPSAPASVQTATPPRSGYVRPGSQIDIKV